MRLLAVGDKTDQKVAISARKLTVLGPKQAYHYGISKERINNMIASIIYLIAGFIELLVGLRFVLLLLGANPASSFVSWIYNWSEPLIAPFYGIFGQRSATHTNGGVVVASVFDWTALIALIIYGLIAGLILGFMRRRTVV